jgi:hypothetical protein
MPTQRSRENRKKEEKKKKEKERNEIRENGIVFPIIELLFFYSFLCLLCFLCPSAFQLVPCNP